jgi:N-methylhydantoinase A/oxoprolinase/acetone carboxylase beta subunit
VEKLSLRAARAPRATNLTQPHSFTETYFAGKKVRAAVYHRGEVKPGSRLRAPCIVTEYSATTLVPAGAIGVTDLYGNIVISVGS